MNMPALLNQAATLGIRIEVEPLPEDYLGLWLPRRRTIILDSRLTPVETTCTLAHELGHAHHGHEHDLGPNSPLERQADTWAAKHLIDPDAYARAEAIDDTPFAIADELGVLVDVVLHYQRRCLQRLGRRSYSTHPTGQLTNTLARALSA